MAYSVLILRSNKIQADAIREERELHLLFFMVNPFAILYYSIFFDY